MSRPTISISVKIVNGCEWGDLSALGATHEIVGETAKMTNESFTFAGGHRVRLYKFKKNVHFKIPTGIPLDISAVAAGGPPRRR